MRLAKFSVKTYLTLFKKQGRSRSAVVLAFALSNQPQSSRAPSLRVAIGRKGGIPKQPGPRPGSETRDFALGNADQLTLLTTTAVRN